MNRTTVRPDLEIAGQPTLEDLEALKLEGFTGLVNLRRDGEPDQPIDPAAEAELAARIGLDAIHLPVGGAPIDAATVAALDAFLDRHKDGRVLIHCKQGGRAAGLALIHLARSQGWPPEDAIERARAQGLTLPTPVRALVEDFLSR